MKKILKLILFLNIVLGYNNSNAQEQSNFIRLSKTFIGNSKIVEDDLGYMWISTRNGLYKYNGYDFSYTTFKEIFGPDAHINMGRLFSKDYNGNFWLSSLNGSLKKIANNGLYSKFKDSLDLINGKTNISAIKSTKKGMWFGSGNGVLFFYNELSGVDSITKLPRIKNVEQIIRNICITQDKVWISTAKDKLYHYDVISKNLKELNLPVSNHIGNISTTIDKNGHLWIATELQGLFKYDIKNNIFKQYDHINTQGSKFSMFISLFCDDDGIIWAGTDGDGLYKINPSNDEIVIYKHDEVNKFSIGSNTINYITEDKHGNKWIVTKTGQINILPNNNNKIKFYSGSKNNNPNRILTMLKSSDGSLWIGTDGKGINRVFPSNKRIHYGNTEKGKSFFKGRYIQDLIEDAHGNIWIATYQNGLWIYNIKKETFSKITTHDTFGNYSPDIRELFKDSKNRIWATSGVAINVFSENGSPLHIFNNNDKGLYGQISKNICEDENGTIWVGFGRGLFKLNEDKQGLSGSHFLDHEYFSKNNTVNSNNNIRRIKPDFNGNLWIVSTTGFLIKYDILRNKYISFQNKDNLKDISFTTLLVDNPYNIWLGSTNGIHHYNVKTNKVKSYYETDGLYQNNFRIAYKDKEGVFYFGGNDGVNSFMPRDLIKKESVAKLYINSIEILNKPASLMIPDQLNDKIENIESLNLNANQSSFSFQFSAIDNLLNSNYYYAYRLKGFDENWIVPKKERIATYTNIPSGSYSFEVKSGSKKGEWDIAPRNISINIKAPWRLHPWAYTVYFILVALLTYGIIRWIKLKNKLAKEEWQHYKEKELYALKMNFFAKMSHEIQTPLTLISGPIDDMLSRAKANGNLLLKNRLSILKNNTNRLSRIAKELMTVRNRELGRLRVYASKNDLKNHLSEIALSFSEQANFKNIDLIQDFPDEEIMIWYDNDKIEHVIYNLLSNAFKFTPREGSIIIKIDNSSSDTVKICISDSGPGIPKQELDDIFKIFYQSELGKHKRGLGIGLALTKEMVSLHHGEIDVVSSPQNGTCFSVILSKSENLFSDEEKVTIESKEEPKQQTVKYPEQFNLELKNDLTKKKSKTLLIVEDNIEMQMFLRDVLETSYNLLFAENGKQGIILAEKNKPDLVISDIMMPVMDGLEMCKILQKTKSTAHIPIILLTAKNSSKFKLLGLKTGAIEYLRKPFNFHELLLKIENTISNQEKIVARYKIDLISKPKENSSKSKDDIFMEDLVKQLDIQLDNSDFKLEDLSESLHMSYSVIYRKCQDITGKSLVEFVRSLRLKKAALLIVKKGYNISEAAFTVGYKDAKYFTKRFKEEFKTTPNELKKEVNSFDISTILEKYNLTI
ncbi:response regulator [Aureibaculum sp. 2210JD6-5]|uniref:hybrid sensor histidine kinase/response regulator transcription factor n=1 Tax=Aureibaculum sp. 2210JD6-5 TaxID=3103957 RepID=UPI002AAC6646|nr:two-component regulator propeller domain-containing protein [Aureibaculum sp. 2210JD6-5]MDY7396041.1 response regulator [Aureibaculum sp. 2210JD6-5]